MPICILVEFKNKVALQSLVNPIFKFHFLYCRLSYDQAGWFSILNIERYIQSKNKMVLFANDQQNTSLLTWQYKIQFFRTSSKIVNLMGEFPFLLCLLYSNILSSREMLKFINIVPTTHKNSCNSTLQ